MKNTIAVFSGLVLISTALITSYIYLYREVRSLKSANSNQASLTSNDVIALVDDRLISIEKRKAQELPFSLESQFQMASTTTPDNKLIYGDVDARITLQECADIECPYCGKEGKELEKRIGHPHFRRLPLASLARIFHQRIDYWGTGEISGLGQLQPHSYFQRVKASQQQYKIKCQKPKFQPQPSHIGSGQVWRV